MKQRFVAEEKARTPKDNSPGPGPGLREKADLGDELDEVRLWRRFVLE